MRSLPPLIAAAALGAASLAAFAAPSPLQETADPAACLLPASLATPQPAATPAGNVVVDPKRAWLWSPLTDACSGESFTLAQFAPKAVFVHPMATW
jgi:hypothetical protein